MTKIQANIIIVILSVIAVVGIAYVTIDYSLQHNRRETVEVKLPNVNESHSDKNPIKNE